MFSSFFGKRRSSPSEDDTPPIPGPRPDDSFVVVDPTSPGQGGLYPSVSGIPYPQRPAPLPPARQNLKVDTSFHYLEGVPFTLSRDIKMWANKDTYATEIGDLLAFLTNRFNIDKYNYDFSVEKSVLKEC